MSDFVEQCRREWRRLNVPDPLAEEMAADLTADLAEAEAEGVSAEEFLGNSVFDPQSFAASWAAERGIIPAPPSRRPRGRPLVLVAFTVVAAMTLLVAALLLVTGEPKVSLVTTRAAAPRLQSPPAAPFFPPPGIHRQVILHTSAAAPVEWILLFLASVALGFAAWLWSSRRRSLPPNAPA
jgi:hypothetical protein